MTEELDLITEEPVTPPPEVGPRRVGRRSGAHLVKNVEINDSIVFGKDFIAPVYNQKGMEQFYEISGRNGSTFSVEDFLAHRVVRDVIRNNPQFTEADISVDGLVDGTAPILNNFNFITDPSSKDTTSGAEMPPAQKAFGNVGKVFSFFARGPSGEKITPGEFGEGMKSKILPPLQIMLFLRYLR